MTTKRILVVVFSLGFLAAVAPLRGDDGSASKFQIRLYGGLSYLSGGDVNDGVGGLFQVNWDLASATGYTVNGGFNAAHLGMSFGGDVIFQITPNFGIGVGAGYLQASKRSSMTTSVNSLLTFDGKPSFNALPIKLGAFFTFPLGRGVNIHFNVGGGYYIAEMTSMFRYGLGSNYVELDNNAKADGFGFQGGIGFDFRVTSNVFLFIEAEGQIANFGGFKGTSTGSTSLGSYNENGTLYYYERQSMGPQLYPMILVLATPPSGQGLFNVREATVNFNGGQFVVGILFKL